MELLSGKRFLALRSFIVIAVGLIVGLLLPHPFWVGLIVVAVSVVPAIFVSQRFFYLTLLSLSVSYGTLSLPEPLPAEIYGRTLTVEARLGKKSGDYSVVSITTPQTLRGRKLLLYMAKDEEQGSLLKLDGEILRLSFPHNPGMRNRSRQLELKGIIGRFNGNYTMLAPPEGIFLWLNKTRKALIERNKELFGSESGFYTALLLGERSEISQELFYDMRRTGTLHILSVSGLNVGILVAFLYLILRFVPVKRVWMLIPLTLMLLAYIALVGPEPPILRASLMSLAVAAGFALERKVLPLNGLALAALGIILLEPTEIFDVGFQLSFAATLGIILAADFLSEVLASKKLHRKPPSFLVKCIILPIAMSVLATLFTMPILASNLHRVTIAPLWANLPVIPLISFVLPFGLVALLLSVIWFPLGQIMGWVVFGLLWIVDKLLHYLPGSLTTTAAWPIGVTIAIFLSALVMHTEKASPRRWFYTLGILLVGANLAVWPWALESTRPRLTLLDTYHGNVAVLESDTRIILLNAGSRAETVVIDYLESRGISKIDWVLCLSDNEGDLSGLDSLKTRFKISEVGSVLQDEATFLLPRTGILKLPSVSVEYDLATRSKPYFVVESDQRKIAFVSESRRIDTTADFNYLLNKHLRPKVKGVKLISKEPMSGVKTDVIRERGGEIIDL